MIWFQFLQEKQQLEREKVLEDIENFEASDLKPTEVNERISLPTEEQIHNERLNRELITEAIAEEITEAGENDNRERTSSGGSGSKFAIKNTCTVQWWKPSQAIFIAGPDLNITIMAAPLYRLR